MPDDPNRLRISDLCINSTGAPRATPIARPNKHPRNFSRMIVGSRYSLDEYFTDCVSNDVLMQARDFA